MAAIALPLHQIQWNGHISHSWIVAISSNSMKWSHLPQLNSCHFIEFDVPRQMAEAFNQIWWNGYEYSMKWHQIWWTVHRIRWNDTEFDERFTEFGVISWKTNSMKWLWILMKRHRIWCTVHRIRWNDTQFDERFTEFSVISTKT